MVKTLIKKELEIAKKLYNELKAEREKIRKDNNYTSKGKDELIKKTDDRFLPSLNIQKEKLVELVDKGKEKLVKKWSTLNLLTDTGYQLGLQNTITLLSVQGLTKADALARIEFYKQDFSAMAMIKSVLQNRGDSLGIEIAVQIPEDRREQNLSALDKLAMGFSTYLSQPSEDALLLFSGWEMFLETLDEDLSYK